MPNGDTLVLPHSPTPEQIHHNTGDAGDTDETSNTGETSDTGNTGKTGNTSVTGDTSKTGDTGKIDSEASDIELDTEHVITNYNNKVYCRYYLCAEEGYGSAWVSKNTLTRYMKAQNSIAIHTELSSSEFSLD
ncbi:10590_t:CDS:2, partial [Gigaspora margarita]